MSVPQFTQLPLAPQEEWRPVVGYEGWYEVSDHGRVRRVAGGRGTRAGYLLTPSPTPKGYRTATLCTGRDQRKCPIHRLVAAAFIGPLPPGMEVNHIDTDRANNWRGNLEYVTPLGNSRHMVAMGNSMRGERSPLARLTEADVIAIRALRRDGAQLKDIAARFGVSPQTICDITKGRGWKHVA